MKRIAITATAIAAILITGIVHGIWTGRWEWSDEPAASVARLPQVPMEFGDWQGVRLDSESRDLDGASACLNRRYTHRATGAGVTILLLCGRPGPVSIHPPDSCYAAGGYQVIAPTMFNAADASPGAEFRVARMRKKRAGDQSQFRIFWAWNNGQGWRVPADPRMGYASSKVLFKLYVIRELADFEEPLDNDPSVEFMSQFLPPLDKTLFDRS
jgi:hypothetical protein